VKALATRALVIFGAALGAALVGALIHGRDPEILPAAALMTLMAAPAVLIHLVACWRSTRRRVRVLAFWIPAGLTAAAFAAMALWARAAASEAGYSDGSDDMAALTLVVVLWSLAGAGAAVMLHHKRGGA